MMPERAKPGEAVAERIETPHGVLYKPQPMWIQIPMLFAAFGGSIGLAWLVGVMIGGLSEGAQIFLYVVYLMVFMFGYSLWMARLQALGMELIGRGLLKALFVILILRRKPEGMEELMPTKEKLLKFAVRAQRAASAFWMVAIPLAAGAGAGSLLMQSEAGWMMRGLLTSSGCLAWGTALAMLARRGYLPLPEE